MRGTTHTSPSLEAGSNERNYTYMYLSFIRGRLLLEVGSNKRGTTPTFPAESFLLSSQLPPETVCWRDWSCHLDC